MRGVSTFLFAVMAIGLPAQDRVLPRVEGEVLHANTLEFGVLVVRDVVAIPSLNGQVLRFDQCQGAAYGGTVTGQVETDLTTGGFRLRLDLTKADLAAFIRQFRGNPSNLGGQVTGWIELDIPEGRPDRMTGRGEMHISSATLVQFPLLANFLVGDPTSARNQDSLDATFTIADSRVALGETILRSAAANITFSGTIGLDGELNIELVPELRMKVVAAVTAGVINRLLAPIGRSAARAMLRGQVTSPVLVMDPFGLKSE